jgi:lysophospholipase L1-like esterase
LSHTNLLISSAMKNFKAFSHPCLFVAAFALLSFALIGRADTVPKAPPGEQWKTAYFKRGFVGKFQAGWAGGVDATIRTRIVLPFDGSQVRVVLAPMRDAETVVSKITLARGKEGEPAGVIEGAPLALNFAGAPKVTIAANGADAVSDAAEAPIRRGVWYLQQSYSSEKYLYAYSVDGYFRQPGDHHEAPKLEQLAAGAWPGNVYRVEVLTADTRPIVLCYGDSITAGYNSTPNAGKSYPEVLGRLTNLPTLNLGVNGDLIQQTAGVPALVHSCNGVETVIVLMGINDIIGGNVKTTADYAQIASNLISNLKRDGKKVFWGTITPATGNKNFDASPEKETLRQSINAWIRQKSGADAVLDFDAALADPQNPARLKAEYQSDWLHPNDAGYQKMAEVAAKAF